MSAAMAWVRMEFASPSSMFAGRIGENVVVSDHPVLAVDGEQILFAFNDIDEATSFLLREATDTTTIFRHNGRDWDRVEKPKRAT